jgi:fermentation-respiration switch protein FrsA (DUF1100 family)
VPRIKASAPPRSLAEALRSADDESLRRLFCLRPDLIHPIPADLGQLAIRATTGPSVSRAMDRLDALVLHVAHVMAALADPTDWDELHASLEDLTDDELRAALTALRDRMLVWGDDTALHLVRNARESFGLHPCGLGNSFAESRRQVAAYVKDPQSLFDLMNQAPTEAKAVVDRLLWGPPVGSVAGADRIVTAETARTPIEWLLAREILVASDRDTVMLPREVALLLRDGAMVRGATPREGDLTGTKRDASLIERTAGANAFGFIRRVEELLSAWTVAPATMLRSGGVGVRDLARTAQTLDVDESMAALIIEVAFSAGLIGSDGETDEMWLPTTTSDIWLSRTEPDKWISLAQAWLTSPRASSLIGTEVGGKRVSVLSQDVERTGTPDLRRAILEILADADPGSTPSPDSVMSVLIWRRPRRHSAARDAIARSTMTEAERIGFTGLGALSAQGRAILTGGDAAKHLRSTLPELIDHVVVQADLTIVAPGPLTSDAAHDIGLLADVESKGAATVYRINDASIRRALDAGLSSMAIIDILTQRSRTDLPQPLRYLVDDVARRHGSIRVGAASSYIRSDDETAISALLGDRRMASLRLVRIAPTVAVAGASPDLVLEKLRDAGLAPVAESPDGVVMIRGRDERRAPAAKRKPSAEVDPAEPSEQLVAAALRALRAGDRATAARPDADAVVPRSTTAETLDLLRTALENESAIWIGYSDPQGAATERVVEPLALEGGFLTAYDTRSAEVRTFTIARITGVATIAPT